MKLSIILLSSNKFERLALENLGILLNKLKSKVNCDFVLASSADNSLDLNTECKFVHDEIFSERLIKAIDKTESDFVMLWLDDYRLNSINFVLFEKCFKLFSILNAGACKLTPVEYPKILIPGISDFGMFDYYPLGRLNTQPTIYQKEFLKSLIIPKESLWEFENNHSIRSISKNKMVIGSLSYIINYDEIIKRGKFLRKYKKLYPSIKNIESMSLREAAVNYFTNKIYRFLMKIFGYNKLKKIKKIFI